MMMTQEMEAEFRRVERSAGLLNDLKSQQALRQYRRDLEYARAYRAPDRGPAVMI